MNALRAIQAVHTGATEGAILDALAVEPLPLHEVAQRVGHSILATEVFLRYLRARGAVRRSPGADNVMVWRRTGAPA